MTARRRPFGTFLREVDAAPFVSNLPAPFQALIPGFMLSPTTRPYLDVSGAVRVRLVWRHREHQETFVAEWYLKGRLSDDIMVALEKALKVSGG